ACFEDLAVDPDARARRLPRGDRFLARSGGFGRAGDRLDTFTRTALARASGDRVLPPALRRRRGRGRRFECRLGLGARSDWACFGLLARAAWGVRGAALRLKPPEGGCGRGVVARVVRASRRAVTSVAPAPGAPSRLDRRRPRRA